jgi:hypothetical protein
MTLNEKFDEADRLTTSRESHNLKCVEIAEDFAIGFTKWCASDEAQTLIKDLMLVGEINKVLELKDLMKIYKKDKSL